MKLAIKAPALFILMALAFGAGARQATAADGQDVFNDNCAVCHSTEAGTNKLGPSLFGIVGRKAGTVDGYTYAPAMKQSGLTWDRATLDKYIADPQGVVPGTKMLFPGVKNADDRKAVIDYLASLH